MAASRVIAAARRAWWPTCSTGDFGPKAPNKVWVTDITYIRTYEGWLFLAAVMDLYSRQIVGWATASTMTSDLVLQALVAAAWRRKPGPGVMVHSDQGCQFTSSDWQSFLKRTGWCRA